MKKLISLIAGILLISSLAFAGGGIGGGPIGVGGQVDGSGTPGGTPGSVQCNTAGAFGACTNLTDVVYALPNANTSGNAGTATALAANGANCASGQAPLGVNASGVAEGCFEVASYSQAIPLVVGGGTVDAITADYSPNVTLSDEVIVAFRSTGTNTSTTPSFAPDGLTAYTIVKHGGVALSTGDIGAAGMTCVLHYDPTNTRWELLNPVKPSGEVTCTIVNFPSSASDPSTTVGNAKDVTGRNTICWWDGTKVRCIGASLTPVIDDPDNFAANFTAENLYGGTFIANAAGTAALPDPAVGMNFTYVLEGANANIIDPLGTGTADTIVMNGLAAAQDENITSSTSGAMCVFQYRAANSWMATCTGFVEATPP